MLVSGMVSSSARAIDLGDAAALSALGQPLRVAISLKATEGDAFAADCFRLVHPAGDDPPGIVTARVSLERGAAGPRLIVRTTQPVGDLAVRLAVETRCGSPVRRDYMLLLDPSAAVSVPTVAAIQLPAQLPQLSVVAEANAPQAREPGQERPATTTASANSFGKKTAAARREPPESSGTGVARIAQRPVGVDVQMAPAVLRYAIADLAPGRSLRPVAAIGDAVRLPSPRPEAEIDRSKDMWWTIAVAVTGFGVIVLGAIVVRHGRGAPTTSSSSSEARGTTRTGPRSSTNLSAAPVNLSHANIPTDALLTRAAPTTRAWVSPATAVTLPNLSTASKSRTSSPEETLDTLFNEIDSDLNVETAIRKVHAAAASGSPEYDIGCEAILKAIEAAERDLMLMPSAPSDAAMGHALEDELLVKPKRKAA
jgi:hypothetical protein